MLATVLSFEKTFNYCQIITIVSKNLVNKTSQIVLYFTSKDGNNGESSI